MFRNYRNCGCMSNNYDSDQYETQNDIMENKCNEVSSYEDDMDECSCGFDEEESVFPENPMFGQSYVPIQYMDKTFKPCIGLKMGTIFPELVSPYMPCQDIKEQEFIASQNAVKEGCNR